MELNLQGRVALVTGSGSGIGRDTVFKLAEEGCKIVVSDINADSANETAEELRKAGYGAMAVACDVTSEDEVAHLVAQAQQLGGVDILVNNAGIVKDGYLTKMTEQAWDSVVDIILKGAFLCSRAVLPQMMEKKWGRVINISSRSLFGNPGQTNYSAGKAGLVGFTRALAQEQGRFGVTVNAVAPGFIMTPGMRNLPHFPKLQEAATAKVPVGFLGEPRDISNAVAFLASDVARYISGTTLFVTGGRYSS
ncbi:3-ketoacyl-ACP reductase [Alicycliphilus denitrificans]|uniref:3-oxoacyl-ACP reductase FabG n=1 Tax=Alicycliphilus denitrificans TaxID=179636 RepID=UPI001916C9CA|nr:3-oxoacyl-ACP reductase FabG [Alicycliphilus denitrificans]MBN9576616.1 3-oxoacyl-ACP reductase FabG [Alicycliphilus denitrificans]BCN38241.1 3-ketoacyl-ACP reductase [Alicycliphilus denitrificans]